MSKTLSLVAAALCAAVLLSTGPKWCPAAEKPSAELAESGREPGHEGSSKPSVPQMS